MHDNFTVYCRCGCRDGFCIDFRFAEDLGDVIIESVTSGYGARQPGFFYRLKRRLLAAWFMLRGKEFTLHEVVLDRDLWSDFVYKVNEMDVAYCMKNDP